MAKVPRKASIVARNERPLGDLDDLSATESSTLDPMRRRLRAFTVTSIVIGLALVLAGLVVVDSPAERAEVRAADRVAARHDKAVKRFTTTTAASIAGRKTNNNKDFSALLSYVDERLDAAPRISTNGTTPFGRKHSRAYRTADERQKFALQPFRSLASFLRDGAIPDLAFIAAGRKLVQVSPAKILEGIPVFTGTPLREFVLPAFEKARTDLKKQKPPADSKLLGVDLETYADDVISMTKDGADKLDRQTNFVFDFGARPDDLFRRLGIVETTIKSELATRIDELESSSGA